MSNRGAHMQTSTPTTERSSHSPYQEPEPSPIEESFWAYAQGVIPELEREVWIGKYRVDFLVSRKKLVVELYGYKYHSSKEKLTRDAERERYLQRQGYHIVRFTGSEVYRNPQKCVQEVLEYMRTLPEPHSAVVPLRSEPITSIESSSSVRNESAPQSRKVAPKRGTWSNAWRRLKVRQRQVLVGFLVLDVAVLLVAVVILLR